MFRDSLVVSKQKTNKQDWNEQRWVVEYDLLGDFKCLFVLFFFHFCVDAFSSLNFFCYFFLFEQFKTTININ